MDGSSVSPVIQRKVEQFIKEATKFTGELLRLWKDASRDRKFEIAAVFVFPFRTLIPGVNETLPKHPNTCESLKGQITYHEWLAGVYERKRHDMDDKMVKLVTSSYTRLISLLDQAYLPLASHSLYVPLSPVLVWAVCASYEEDDPDHEGLFPDWA